MNGDIKAARELLSELRDAYKSLPRRLQTQVTYLLRKNSCSGDTESKTIGTDTLRVEPVVSIR
jgi:hypothetical protein